MRVVTHSAISVGRRRHSPRRRRGAFTQREAPLGPNADQWNVRVWRTKASPHDFGARDDETIRRISAACSGVEPEAARMETPPPGLRRSVASAYPGMSPVEPGVCCLIDPAKAAKHDIWSCPAPRWPAADKSRLDNGSINTPRTTAENFIPNAPCANFSKQSLFFRYHPAHLFGRVSTPASPLSAPKARRAPFSSQASALIRARSWSCGGRRTNISDPSVSRVSVMSPSS